ncbi:hypothetical protein Pelo_8204 [Pelomyxa schiedti]|nr:hypothetical protein Pelo_8204 [Pelomyxa schiedti]
MSRSSFPPKASWPGCKAAQPSDASTQTTSATTPAPTQTPTPVAAPPGTTPAAAAAAAQTTPATPDMQQPPPVSCDIGATDNSTSGTSTQPTATSDTSENPLLTKAADSVIDVEPKSDNAQRHKYWDHWPNDCLKVTFKRYECCTVANKILGFKQGVDTPKIYTVLGDPEDCKTSVKQLTAEVKKGKTNWNCRMIPFEKFLMYTNGKSTEEVLDFFRKEKGLTEQGGLYVSGVKHTKDPSLFEKAFQVFKEMVEDHNITLIISCTNPLILHQAPLSLALYDYILISIVSPSVALHLLEHFFGTAPEENMFGTVPNKLWEQMKQVAGALYGKPILFKLFLKSLQGFCRNSNPLPHMADIIKIAWDSITNQCSESSKNQGRKMHKLLKFHQVKSSYRSGDSITGWAYFIPLPNAMRIYLPFPFAAASCNPKEWAPPSTWVKEIELLKSMKGNLFEMCCASSFMFPSSLLLMVIFANTPFQSHPDLREGFVSFDTLKERGSDWVFDQVIGCCKSDINTSGKAERVDFFTPGTKREEYMNNPKIPCQVINCIQQAYVDMNMEYTLLCQPLKLKLLQP